MRCHICDAIIANPTIDETTGKPDPCPTCISESYEHHGITPLHLVGVDDILDEDFDTLLVGYKPE